MKWLKKLWNRLFKKPKPKFKPSGQYVNNDPGYLEASKKTTIYYDNGKPSEEYGMEP